MQAQHPRPQRQAENAWPIVFERLVGLRGDVRIAGELAEVLAASPARVALLAPRSAPGVLDDPGVSGVANEDHGVATSAARALEDAGLVALELSANVDTNRDGVDFQGSSLVVLRVEFLGAAARRRDAGNLLASALTSCIRVVLGLADGVLADEVDGLVHQAAVARAASRCRRGCGC